ncbi:hypothetical protein B0H13DRAFT_1859021 [Mycena leptocephala]|nr:hypothetical protein B0H13DRAFT_1859021 [Mycena leptocephala]
MSMRRDTNSGSDALKGIEVVLPRLDEDGDGEQEGQEINTQGRRMVHRRGELRNTFTGRSSECSGSQSDGTTPNGTAWSSLAVMGHSGGDGIMEGIDLLKR